MRKWLWLVLAVLVAAAVAPVAAIGAETLTFEGNEFEVVWKHPRLKLEKQSGELFSRIMSADEFVRQIKLDRREYTDSDGVSRPSLAANIPGALIAQQVCDPATRYYRYGGNDVGIALEISDFYPYNIIELPDQDGRLYSIPRVQIHTDTVITSTTPEALALLIPVVEAVRTGDPDGGGCVWLLLLPGYAAPLPANPDLSQLSMLRILIRGVVKVPGRTFLPPSAPVPSPPGPPGKG